MGIRDGGEPEYRIQVNLSISEKKRVDAYMQFTGQRAYSSTMRQLALTELSRWEEANGKKEQ